LPFELLVLQYGSRVLERAGRASNRSSNSDQ
jgi:hypothetical protein